MASLLRPKALQVVRASASARRHGSRRVNIRPLPAVGRCGAAFTVGRVLSFRLRYPSLGRLPSVPSFRRSKRTRFVRSRETSYTLSAVELAGFTSGASRGWCVVYLFKRPVGRAERLGPNNLNRLLACADMPLR